MVNASSACYELKIDDFDFDDFVLTMMTVTVMPSFAIVTMVVFRQRRRQWDPGMPTKMPACRNVVDPTVAASPFLIIWDPGRVLAPSLRSLPTVEHDNGNLLVCCNGLTPMMTVRLTWDSLRSTRPIRSTCCCLPMTMTSVSRRSVSVFHYCHPVLSCPTMPNVDSYISSQQQVTILLVVMPMVP